MANNMDYKTLVERQGWTLNQKIDHSLGVIDQFASHYNGNVYVSFSGGKDSCVMLSLVEMIIPNVPCMFVMTGCESPSVCRFVRQMKESHNIEIVQPRKTLRQVFSEYGFPLVSKAVSRHIDMVRKNPYSQTSRDLLRRDNRNRIPERWMYLLNEPYEVSDRCCFWLKKQPGYEYVKRTGRFPFIGLMAAESGTRTAIYLKRGGCNSFNNDGKAHPSSFPLAIWTDKDVWQYINDRQLQIPDIYGKGVTRTGCMGCGFGAHIDHNNIDVMRELWPRWYDMVMSYENNGTTYGDALAKTIERGKHFKKYGNY